MASDPKFYYQATKDVYNDARSEHALPGWKTIEMPPQDSSSPHNNYYGRAYYNPSTGEVVIAHRGSLDPKLLLQSAGAREDWGEVDKALLQGKWHPQFDSAHDFTKHVMNEVSKDPDFIKSHATLDITHTGHSKGSAIAQLEAARMGQHAYSYDGPGIGGYLTQDLKNSDGSPMFTEANISAARKNVEVLSHPNLVNQTGIHHGEVYQGNWEDYNNYGKDMTDNLPHSGPGEMAFKAGQNVAQGISSFAHTQSGHKLEEIEKHSNPDTTLPNEYKHTVPNEIHSMYDVLKNSSSKDDDPWAHKLGANASSLNGPHQDPEGLEWYNEKKKAPEELPGAPEPMSHHPANPDSEHPSNNATNDLLNNNTIPPDPMADADHATPTVHPSDPAVNDLLNNNTIPPDPMADADHATPTVHPSDPAVNDLLNNNTIPPDPMAETEHPSDPAVNDLLNNNTIPPDPMADAEHPSDPAVNDLLNNNTIPPDPMAETDHPSDPAVNDLLNNNTIPPDPVADAEHPSDPAVNDLLNNNTIPPDPMADADHPSDPALNDLLNNNTIPPDPMADADHAAPTDFQSDPVSGDHDTPQETGAEHPSENTPNDILSNDTIPADSMAETGHDAQADFQSEPVPENHDTPPEPQPEPEHHDAQADFQSEPVPENHDTPPEPQPEPEHHDPPPPEPEPEHHDTPPEPDPEPEHQDAPPDPAPEASSDSSGDHGTATEQ